MYHPMLYLVSPSMSLRENGINKQDTPKIENSLKASKNIIFDSTYGESNMKQIDKAIMSLLIMKNTIKLRAFFQSVLKPKYRVPYFYYEMLSSSEQKVVWKNTIIRKGVTNIRAPITAQITDEITESQD
eukprot:403332719